MIAVNEYIERLERAKKQGLVTAGEAAETQASAAAAAEQLEGSVATANKNSDPPQPIEVASSRLNNDGQPTSGHTTPKKKNKRRNKKKKKKQSPPAMLPVKEPQEPPPKLRGLNETTMMDYYVQFGQTDPPTIPVETLFRDKEPSESSNHNNFPVGELVEYVSSLSVRVSSAEARAKDALLQDAMIYDMRQAAEVHRQVRAYAQQMIRPGLVLEDFCTLLEDKNRELVGERGLERGIAFPTGVSLNHVAAHYTPNTGDRTVLQYNDVLKIDFGTHVNGHLVDSAWTVAFDERYDPLLEAVQAATNAGLKEAGIDARICDVATEIHQVMESFEVEMPSGEVRPVKAIRGLSGHSIQRYHIHGGKHVPSTPGAVSESDIMEEGEVFAIETFGSTGRGYVVEDGECSHYLKTWNAPHVPLRLTSAKKLLRHINTTFGTLGFCRRWLDRPDGGSTFLHGQEGRQERYLGALQHLCQQGLIQPCPPLVDVPGSYTAQYEHTIILRPTCKEIVTRGLDY